MYIHAPSLCNYIVNPLLSLSPFLPPSLSLSLSLSLPPSLYLSLYDSISQESLEEHLSRLDLIVTTVEVATEMQDAIDATVLSLSNEVLSELK